MSNIKKILKKLALKKPKVREECINNADNKVICDIKTLSKTACNNTDLSNSSILKKHKKLRHILRRISNSKTLKEVKKLLLKSNQRHGRGIFTLLGSIIVPSVIKLITDNV